MIVDETLREAANWPENREFRILEPMNRIALNVILRTLFGAEEPEFAELREILPSFMKLGSVMAFVPRPPFRTGPDATAPGASWMNPDGQSTGSYSH
jgi:cytochrome P450 family 138